ncbi:type VI secretion system baseplate subunit TssG [Serratia sp. DD3]|uniref:type VI secretion system baseplate subunit TssG n=1 Tax=Serratia sp. DD3 TaxID=1410619 RepID=UPI00055C10E5|nr:type VI secretion system baseplate subunit TssG [Serratia sp. DD3]
MTDDDKNSPRPLPAFWLDPAGGDHTAEFNFYRFCQLIEQTTQRQLGTGNTPDSDPVRFRPNPHLGFPAGELKRTETDPDFPDAPPTIRTQFFGLYGVTSPLPTAMIDDINQGREGADATAAFLDIFNHRLITQFYRIWRKYNYPATFEAGGKDKLSQSLMALTGITHSVKQPASHLLALLPSMTHPTLTAEGIADVIRTQAPATRVTVHPHHPVKMAVAESSQLNMSQPQSLGDYLVLGDELNDANYCTRVELYTENTDEALGWMPDGQLRQDIIALLQVYLGCDYDLQLWLTLPTALLPMPRLGETPLFAGYNIMLGLDDDNLDELPQTARVWVGRLREEMSGND